MDNKNGENFTKKDLLKLLDLSGDEIIKILDIADTLKAEWKDKKKHDLHLLAGKTLVMIFKKNSTRTRVSFETGIFQLGGHGIYLSEVGSQMERNEPVRDTARVLSRYGDGIMIRTLNQSEVEEFAKYASVPVINGLTDFAHPCQVLADLMTIREYKGGLEGLKICYIGDGNNMTNSIIVGGLKCGMDVSVACPKDHHPHKTILDFAKSVTDACFKLTDDPRVAAHDADIIFTDVWASMGQEHEIAERQKTFSGYCVDNEIIELAKPSCMVLHCLPAHRDEEITEEVFEKHSNEIFDEAENRLHVQKAIMYLLMK